MGGIDGLLMRSGEQSYQDTISQSHGEDNSLTKKQFLSLMARTTVLPRYNFSVSW